MSFREDRRCGALEAAESLAIVFPKVATRLMLDCL
jgi:hypothetical protein